MENTNSVFPIKEEPELNILSDDGDDGDNINGCNTGEDEENVNFYCFWSFKMISHSISLTSSFTVQWKRSARRLLSGEDKLRTIHQQNLR